MDAPVVPIHEAAAPPAASKSTFCTGVPRNDPVTRMPDATVYSANRMMRKGHVLADDHFEQMVPGLGRGTRREREPRARATRTMLTSG